MRTLRKSFFLAAIATAAVSGTARAADESLLVVVESAPGAAVDAREVRETIGAELGIAVLAPSDAGAANASNVLIVTVDKTEIRMSLRGGAAGLVARTIPVPPDRPARLREIGWLAGNLARDQVSGIVAVPADGPAMSRPRVVAAADAPPATEPPPALSALPTTLGPASDPAETLSARPAEAPASQGPRWTITAAGGPTANTYDLKGETATGSRIGSTGYQLEIERQSSPGDLIFGGALDAGPAYSGFGVAGFLGSCWRYRRLFLEGTGGVGIELATSSQRVVTNSSVTGTTSTTTEATGQPIPFVRGLVEMGLSITKSVDLVARVGFHLTSAEAGGSWETDFISTGAGLRFRLP